MPEPAPGSLRPLSRAQRQRLARIAKGRSDEALHVLEGPRAVRDALATGAVAELWVRSDLDPDLRGELLDGARDALVVVGEGSASEFDRIGRTVTTQGVIALVRDVALPLDDLVRRSGMLLWLDGLQDPGNVGAVIRVAAAFGLAGVLVSRGGADPLGAKALRASAGLALRVPFARGTDVEIAEAVAARPVWSLERDGDDLFGLTAEVPADLVLVVGAEGSGPGEAARGAARQVGIPVDDAVDSLNAAVAAGIAVATLCRGAGARR